MANKLEKHPAEIGAATGARQTRTTRPTGVRAVMKTLSAARPAVSRSAADVAAARRMLDLLKAGADVRDRKVRKTRAAIRAGKYENDLKTDVALDRLLEDLELA